MSLVLPTSGEDELELLTRRLRNAITRQEARQWYWVVRAGVNCRAQPLQNRGVRAPGNAWGARSPTSAGRVAKGGVGPLMRPSTNQANIGGCVPPQPIFRRAYRDFL